MFISLYYIILYYLFIYYPFISYIYYIILFVFTYRRLLNCKTACLVSRDCINWISLCWAEPGISEGGNVSLPALSSLTAHKSSRCNNWTSFVMLIAWKSINFTTVQVQTRKLRTWSSDLVVVVVKYCIIFV